MESFFLLVILVTFFMIKLFSETKSNCRYQAVADAQKQRGDKWRSRICNGREGGFLFIQEYGNNIEFRKILIDECNKILDSIPEMEGIHVELYCSQKSEYARDFIIRNMYFAKYGVVPINWLRGYIQLYQIADGFNRKPSNEGIAAYFKWYENELRNNGFSDAKISAIRVGPDRIPAVWYFENCAYDRAYIGKMTGYL